MNLNDFMVEKMRVFYFVGKYLHYFKDV